jgi:hypothetical protein
LRPDLRNKPLGFRRWQCVKRGDLFG